MQEAQPAPHQVELDLVDGSESDEEERDPVEPGARRSDSKLTSLETESVSQSAMSPPHSMKQLAVQRRPSGQRL